MSLHRLSFASFPIPLGGGRDLPCGRVEFSTNDAVHSIAHVKIKSSFFDFTIETEPAKLTFIEVLQV